jgi:transcriptional regulator with XRE-family HTH domain
MSPDELREVREELKCTVRELAATLGVDSAEIFAWEKGERFPTKKHVADLSKLRLMGAGAISRKPTRKGNAPLKGAARLADPAFWQLVRKLVEHPELFDRAQHLATEFEDPAGSTGISVPP